MQIQHLKLINFRNYDDLLLTFSPNINILYGDNGSGKTNIVEAIFSLAVTKSFRTNNDKLLIKKGEEKAIIKGKFLENVEQNYELNISYEGKKAYINGNLQKKLSDYISKLSIVVFSPDDLKIIKDSPAIRRKFLNVDLSLLDSNYLNYLAYYNKLLKQRNAYLKTIAINGNSSYDYLDILTEKLIDYGLKVKNFRIKFFKEINREISNLYNKISGIDSLNLLYISQYENFSKDELKKIYKKNLSKDLLIGKTCIGIHHDDFIFQTSFGNLKDYGSEGQQKNAIIAYKLAEISLFKLIKGYYPILILDDLFSELDENKIKNIYSLLVGNMQIFITTTNIMFISSEIKEKSKVFKIISGKVEEEN